MKNISKYKCLECGWIGHEHEMGSDSRQGHDNADEAWSNWICPNCDEWQELEDYIELTSTKGINHERSSDKTLY